MTAQNSTPRTLNNAETMIPRHKTAALHGGKHFHGVEDLLPFMNFKEASAMAASIVILQPQEVLGDDRNQKFQGTHEGSEMRRCNQLRSTTVGLLFLKPVLMYTHSSQERN